MAVQTGWVTRRINTTGTSQYTTIAPPGCKANIAILKNEDTTDTVWFKIGDDILTAAVNELGVGGSFPLAPGESIVLNGIEASHIAYITDAQVNAWLKILAYVGRGFRATL